MLVSTGPCCCCGVTFHSRPSISGVGISETVLEYVASTPFTLALAVLGGQVPCTVAGIGIDWLPGVAWPLPLEFGYFSEEEEEEVPKGRDVNMETEVRL